VTVAHRWAGADGTAILTWLLVLLAWQRESSLIGT
jgi:hypothetical protein